MVPLNSKFTLSSKDTRQAEMMQAFDDDTPELQYAIQIIMYCGEYLQTKPTESSTGHPRKKCNHARARKQVVLGVDETVQHTRMVVMSSNTRAMK